MELTTILLSPHDQDTKKINEMYKFYVNIWSETWKELGVSGSTLHDDFFRFTHKLAIYNHGLPVAFHGYCKFDLDNLSHQNHSYFTKLKAPVVEELKKRGFKHIYTAEYMCVHPEYRKISNFYLGEVLGGFSMQNFRSIPCDVAITVSRNDRSVNKMCKMYGAYPIFENLALNNVEVDVMVFEPSKIKDNPNPDIQRVINSLKEQIYINYDKGVAA